LLQIIFASRTHSQLSQFVGELRRTPFADQLSLVALGSRKARRRRPRSRRCRCRACRAEERRLLLRPSPALNGFLCCAAQPRARGLRCGESFAAHARGTSHRSRLALLYVQTLCINDSVLRLGSPALISERCLELQMAPPAGGKPKKAAVEGGGGGGGRAAAARRAGGGGGRCGYLAAGSGAAGTTRDAILAQPMDIEELAKLGGWWVNEWAAGSGGCRVC
jgi:hypothetical protein